MLLAEFTRVCFSGIPLLQTPFGQLEGSGLIIKEGVLISGIVLYTFLYSLDRAWCPDKRRSFQGYPYGGVPLY